MDWSHLKVKGHGPSGPMSSPQDCLKVSLFECKHQPTNDVLRFESHISVRQLSLLILSKLHLMLQLETEWLLRGVQVGIGSINSLGAIPFFLVQSFFSVSLIPADLHWWCLTHTTSLDFSKLRTDLLIKQQNHPKIIIESEIPPIERQNVRQKNKNKHLWGEKKHHELNIYGMEEENEKQRPISNLAPIYFCGPAFHFSS